MTTSSTEWRENQPIASDGWLISVTAALAGSVPDVQLMAVGCETDEDSVMRARQELRTENRVKIVALRRLGEREIRDLDLKRNEVRPYAGPPSET